MKVSAYTLWNAEKRKFNNDARLPFMIKVGHINGYFKYIQIQNTPWIYCTYLFNNISIFLSAPSLINFLSTQVILNIPLYITTHRWSYTYRLITTGTKYGETYNYKIINFTSFINYNNL